MMPKYKPPQKPRPKVEFTAELLGDSDIVEVKGSDGSRMYMNVRDFEAICESKP